MSRVRAVPCVGIFWGIPDARGGWRLLLDKTPIPQAEPYGDCLTHALGHCEFWESLARLGESGLARRGLPAEPAWHEYEDFPRGRVVYVPGNRRFVVYADRRLQAARFIISVAAEFGIPADACVVRSDSHYRAG